MSGDRRAPARRPRRRRLTRRAGLRLKRVFDTVGAVVGLIVLSPVLGTVALALLVTQGRPILFRQERPGLDAQPFRIVKFRTMRPPRPGETWFRTDQSRLTRLGGLLRRTSVDELPELWNVLRGEMSIVGPRPLLLAYVDRYTEREARRHEMRPGITGWAATHGRHTARFVDRLELDVWYVDHWSFTLDLRIIALTIEQLIRGSGVAETQDLEAIELPARFVEGLTTSGDDAIGSGSTATPGAARGSDGP